MAAVVLLLAGGGYYVASKLSTPTVTADPDHKAAEQKAEQERQELAKLRADAAAREKIEQEAALRRQVEEDTRKKLEAEAATKRQAEEDERKAAEAAETGLRLSPADRQRVQVALTALGFDTGGDRRRLQSRTREMIASWQRGKSYPATGFLTGTQHQALLREAAPALAKYDDDQRKLEEARKKAEDERPKVALSSPPAAARSRPPVAPPRHRVRRRASMACGAAPTIARRRRGGGDFTMHVQMNVAGGSGTWAAAGFRTRHDGQPVALHQDRRLASGRVALHTPWPPGRRVRDGHDDCALRKRYHHRDGAGAEQRRPHLHDQPDALEDRP